jgi:hypothetical protein
VPRPIGPPPSHVVRHLRLDPARPHAGRRSRRHPPARAAVRLSLGPRRHTPWRGCVCTRNVSGKKRRRLGTGVVRRAKARTPRRGGGPQVSSMSWRFTRPRNTTSSCVAWGRGGGGGDCAPRYVASFPFALSDRLSRGSCPPAWSHLDHRVACSRRYANPWTKPSHVGTAAPEYGAQTHTIKADSSPRMLWSAPLLYASVASTICRYPTYGAARSQPPNLDISASASLRAKTNIISHTAYVITRRFQGPWSSPGSLVLPVSIS